MRKSITFIIALALIAMIGFAVFQAFQKQKNETTGVEIGNKAPDFELQVADGEIIKLSDLEGKKVLVNFWASWCEPCLEEMPEIQELYDTKSDDIEILAVNMTVTEKNLQTAKDFIKEQGFTFPVLLDVTNKTSSNYEVLNLPVSYFIDSKGIIRDRYPGAMSLEYMKEMLEKMD
ncbi:TlpA disulfide reductase family protein [Bacillus sp. PS06]|uniref:TlpA disulfide reductase family protein n=1 Tax=Bacillus sp. PS06 TaxID=2764176 RepID=UPI00177B007E|nr:TlpA disulfide reductase family protein [Bacillus sp. PS06]MBD8068182.1 TlpA family protein disulfide reductase [Bacillus sp. PS06]